MKIDDCLLISPRFFILITWMLLIGAVNTFGQAEVNRANYVYHIKKAVQPIVVDGSLDEPDWQNAQVAKDFYRVLPIDTGYASTPTEVMVSYDDKILYFGIICHETIPGDNIIESLRRDFSFGANDNFLLFIDTFNDKTNGFSFGASAGGAQWDGLQSDGGDVSLVWDCKWEMKVKHYENYWIIEMGIPFRNLQFKAGLDNWGINFSRLDLKRNEKSSWAPVPRQFPTASLAFTGTLQWDNPPPKPKVNFSLIPYILGGASTNFQTPETETKVRREAGIDAKISLTPAINLDLTLNPDFSQVDVDEQVTNLDRFELFFPERRRFFLENEDLFTGFGKQGIRPFFSRRIGLDSPVRTGVRLSGKVDEKWRIGFLNMQTGSTDEVPATNFTVASLQRKIFTRSNIGAFVVNKQLTSKDEELTEGYNEYNRVVGVDFNLASADNRWVGKTFYHRSITPDQDTAAYAASASISYNTQQLSIDANMDRVGSDYNAEVGFVRRTGIFQSEPSISYNWYPKSKKIANHGPWFSTEFAWDDQFKLSDRDLRIFYSVEWLNRSEIFAGVSRQYLRLLDDFDPTNSGGDTLRAGTEYVWNAVVARYESDPRKLFTYNGFVRYGGYFGGTRLALEGQVSYRFQPYGSFSVNMAYNNIKLPSQSKRTNLYLIGPKLDVTFTDAIFLTAFLQYNSQVDNINTNIRLQWRYQPVSDLFIVYTDNYFPTELQVKNRAIVLKLSYWFN